MDLISYSKIRKTDNKVNAMEYEINGIKNRIGTVEDELAQHEVFRATQNEYGHVRLSDITGGTIDIDGVKLVRFVVGTSVSGWTETEVDYLCDGVEDQVEINQAIQALPINGGEIIILDGEYNITSKIDISDRNNINIKGSGISTKLTRMWDSTETEGVITLKNSKNCRIENIFIEGNRIDQVDTYNVNICLISSDYNTITGTMCFGNYGVLLSSSNKNTIADNLFNYTFNGVFLKDRSGHNFVSRNECNNIKYYGINIFAQSNYNTIIGNIVTNAYEGIRINNSKDNSVSGNVCTSNDWGIALNLAERNVVSGNALNNNNSRGISMSTSNLNTVTSNTCIKNSYTSTQYTIYLVGDYNNNNLISSNNCFGKDVVIGGGTSNTSVNNKWE